MPGLTSAKPASEVRIRRHRYVWGSVASCWFRDAALELGVIAVIGAVRRFFSVEEAVVWCSDKWMSQLLFDKASQIFS
ncbi:MAG TPA: hypothetical protein VFV48_06515, partial [Pseudomonadales bacterium]|nr:hypothetical protein [Pseudomonadales bacterium]